MPLALAAELDDINHRFQTALHSLESALRTDTPDLIDIGKRRIVLARAARARLRFIDARLCPALVAGPTPAHAAAAQNLRARITALFVASNRHIGEWNSQRVAADWKGYRDATRAMAAAAKTVLATERREVYPLLLTAA